MKEKAKIGGVFHIEHWRDGKLLDKFEAENLVTNEALNHILNVVLHGTPAPSATWYIGLFKNDYTPIPGNTLAVPGFTEAVPTVDYDEAGRQEWDEADAGASGQQITNGSGTGATKATFTMAASNTIYGAFLCNASSGSSGVLFASSRFAAGRPVQDSDQLIITYTLQAASS